MSLDIFAPSKSVVSKGLFGKKIMVYGFNDLGKTYQTSRMEKPYFLSFEKGLSAIDGVPFANIKKWSDFTKVLKQFARNSEKAKELYQTIIIDGTDIMAKYCEKYVSNAYGVNRIKDGNEGFGLWKELETELFFAIDELISLDFTVVFIAHEMVESKDSDRKVPKGDKRLMPLIQDNCDYVIYLKGNNVDEDNNVILSSAYTVQTDEFFARSRFTQTPPFIEEFTAENLEAAIVEGIEKESKVQGFSLVSEDEKRNVYKETKLNYDELMSEIKQVGGQLVEIDKLDEMNNIAEKQLGIGNRVTECKKGQEEVMSVILDEMKELLEEAE
ncbi:hypothetical protein CIL05_07465 [Virgibacillus profundi]|uniref:ATP-binding protein n=1 Tax=Virgibacillus profundi TaxID=2024555 RepID=A0A2A2IEX6_9BACI|nr:ATP-binding protein [Virgibacillus profundi]PAV30299.1 hypothetical protein CIL05_07465 [Virgibacillus profundi]PXY54471.1 hypothetical protein CIT14_07550 [Virgibacillus profundi]